MLPLRVDAVLVVALGALAGALCRCSPWAVGIGTSLVLVALLRVPRGSRATSLVAALAFFVSAWRASNAVASDDLSRERWLVDGTWPMRCAIEGRVARSPVWMGDATRVDVEVLRSTCAGFVGRIGLSVPHDIESTARLELARGDRIEGVAQLAPPYRFWNDADPRPLLARRGVGLTGSALELRVVAPGLGIGAVVDRARNAIRRRIFATYPPHTASMARALVLGEDDLAANDQLAFRRSGLAHLLAVSGMHLVLVVASVVALLRAVFARFAVIAVRIDPLRLASAIGIPLAFLYADLAGGSGSAVRAAFMTGAALLARVVARRPDLPRALALSILAMLVADPLVPFDLSFALSAAATGGLLAIGRPLDSWLTSHLPRVVAIVTKPLAATVAATIACTPILATMSGEIPLTGVVANVLAVPLGEAAALPLCLVHTLLPSWPLAERGSALAASGALDLVRLLARGFASLPAFSVPAPSGAQLAVAAVFAAAPLTSFARAFRVGSLGAILLLEVGLRHHPPELRVTFLDVGQGDAALVELPDGGAILIDGGGLVGSPVDVGERVLRPLLRSRRLARLDVVVLSHPHPDHFGGLVTGLTGISVGAFWDTGQGEREGAGPAYAALLAGLRARGTTIERPSTLCGHRRFGTVLVEILAPCPETNGDRGPNDNSLVLRITYGRRSFLFVGDAERLEERDVMAAAPLRADVLKVGHHGSRTSTSPAFLDAIAPEMAVVSCGIRNRFGHPHRTTRASLAKVPRVFRTDFDGAVMISTDGARLEASARARP